MTERRRRLATLPRDDLERLTSAATAFCALQQVVKPDRHAMLARMWEHTPGGTAAQRTADLDALEQAVIRTRRLLGWRA